MFQPLVLYKKIFINTMKLKLTLSSIALALITSLSFAQSPSLAVTDEELMKYATVMDSVNEMSASVRLELADMVKGSSVMNTTRYNELSKIIDDPAQLEAAKATPEEIAFVKEVTSKKEEEMTRINSTYQSLAKEYVTAPVFNKVKKALTSDPKLKHRYDSLMVELGKDDPSTQP
jgi:hypothetical protein